MLVDASAGWRGVKVAPVISRELDAMRADSKAEPGVRLAGVGHQVGPGMSPAWGPKTR